MTLPFIAGACLQFGCDQEGAEELSNLSERGLELSYWYQIVCFNLLFSV